MSRRKKSTRRQRRKTRSSAPAGPPKQDTSASDPPRRSAPRTATAVVQRQSQRDWVSPLEVVYAIAFVGAAVTLMLSAFEHTIALRESGAHGARSAFEWKVILISVVVLFVLFAQFPRSYFYLHHFDDEGRSPNNHFVKQFTGFTRFTEKFLRLIISGLLILQFKSGQPGFFTDQGFRAARWVDGALKAVEHAVIGIFAPEITVGSREPILGEDSLLYGYASLLFLLIIFWLAWDIVCWLRWQTCILEHKPLPHAVDSSVRRHFGIPLGANTVALQLDRDDSWKLSEDPDGSNAPAELQEAARRDHRFGLASVLSGHRIGIGSMLRLALWPRAQERIAGLVFCLAAAVFAYSGGMVTFTVVALALLLMLGASVRRVHSTRDREDEAEKESIWKVTKQAVAGPLMIVWRYFLPATGPESEPRVDLVRTPSKSGDPLK